MISKKKFDFQIFLVYVESPVYRKNVTCNWWHIVQFRGRDLTSCRPEDVHFGAYFQIFTLLVFSATINIAKILTFNFP